MTERHLIESTIGLAGRLSHTPLGVDKAENCGWHCSRDFSQDAPFFKVIGPSKTWIPAEPHLGAESLPPQENLWKQKRRQRRWLIKSHPEASLGNGVLNDLLDEVPPFPIQQGPNGHSCSFSLGELTDTRLKRTTGIPLAVTVTGNSHNVLRLSALLPEQWIWHRLPNVGMRVSEPSVEKPALWIGDDVSPIHRVKCLVHHKQYNPTRWVAVQRDSGTMILQPEYGELPLDGSLGKDASRIFVRPLFHLSKEQTGGSIHADVSFNPETRSNPPQLAIIDERGFWSVWEVGFTRLRITRELVPKMKICGHFSLGILEQLPSEDRSDVGWHKVLWVGSSDHPGEMGDFDLDTKTEQLGSQAAFSPIRRSSSLLVYNSQQVRVFDLATNLYLPDFIFCRQNSTDYVLDVQMTHDPQYFCVLTTSKLFVLRVYLKPGEELDKPEKAWSILFSTPHFRSSADRSLKLAITQGVRSGRVSCLILLYASTSPWTEAFYLEVSRTNPNRVRCQSNVTGLDELQNAILNRAVQTLCISPARIVAKAPEHLTKTGLALAKKRTKLYQILALRSDMSLASGVCAFSSSPAIRIAVPNQNVSRLSRIEQQRGLLRHSRGRFVVDDDDLVMNNRQPSAADHRYMKAFYEHLCTVSSELNEHRPNPSSRGRAWGSNPFDAVRINVDELLTTGGPLPTRTLLQIMPTFSELSKTSFSAAEWDEEMGRLDGMHPSVAVCSFNLLHSSLGLPLSASLQEAYSRLLEIVDASLPHRVRSDADWQHLTAAFEQIAYDLYLSLRGIGYRDRGESQPHAASGDDMLLDSQTDTLPSSPPRPASVTSMTTPSRRSNSEAAEGEDPAMTLIRSYTGTGKFVPEKKFELLDKWQLGAEPSDYVFDLDRSDDAEISRKRMAKQQAREERKRRRAESLLHLSQDPELPASQPVPSTSFASQPRVVHSQRQVQIAESSQPQSMSQPVPGAFGKRPMKKVKKRKGGF